MSRKSFIESHGATCRNWQRSWSFVNEQEHFIIFGQLDAENVESPHPILDKSWEFGESGRRRPAYNESIEHIRLIQEEGYDLKTHSITLAHDDNSGRSRVKEFGRVLSPKRLVTDDDNWYADDVEYNFLPEEIHDPNQYLEGASQSISVNAYERNKQAREKCLQHHGYSCAVCSFDFTQVYGNIGKNYIHVHHITPLSSVKKEYAIDPIKELVPVCPNCHAMIHRKQQVLGVDDLKAYILKNSN